MSGGRKRSKNVRSKSMRDKSGPQIYRKAYRVNLSQSLAQHRGWDTKDSLPDSGLRGRWTAAVMRPLGQLEVAELVLLLSQGVDAASLHLLWPVIHAHLEADINASQGSSLLELMVGRSEFWATHPHAAQQLVGLIDTRQDELDRSSAPTFADPFAQRYRA